MSQITEAPRASASQATGPQAPIAERVDLLTLSWAGLEEWCQQQRQPKFRAKQLFRWMYLHYETDFDQMTDLPKGFRELLKERATVGTVEVEQVLTSQDGTQKILCRLWDKKRVETVLIPDDKRLTLCVSSQVGCALGCRFCYTASLGPGRNLTVGEYMSQFIHASRLLPEEQRITNVVFMGMGEPLVNFDNLMETLSLLTDERGIHLGKRRITVSTAGLCHQIIELGQRFPVRLAISLHATTDEVRDELMPINQKYNLETLFETLRGYQESTPGYRLPITLEYTLIKDVNHSDADAERLAHLAHSIEGKVNLIPYNEHPGAPYQTPSRNRIERFKRLLEQANVPTTCRLTRGDDIYAACGQLALHGPVQPR